MFLPFIDHMGLGPTEAIQITSSFLELLRKSHNILLYEPPEGISWQLSSKSPEFGIVPHPELFEKAEDLGVYALITGVLNPIEADTLKTGIWPLRKWRTVYEISMVINVADVTSKTLLLSRLESEEISFTSEESQYLKKQDVFDQILLKALPRILKREASAVEKKLAEMPWTGKILAADKDTVKINAGKNLGLRPGSRFEVFERGESITGWEGKRLDMVGKKIGEIKVTSVMEEYSLAVPLKEGAFLPGQIVKSIP